jgi:sortase A
MRAGFRSLLSILFLSLGGVCLFYGARDFLASRFGQSEAARDFERPVPDNPETRAAAQPEPQPAPRVVLIHRGDTLAKLTIPRLDAELYVVEGDGARELRRGPGHLAGTAMPGDDGNCVIAGHRDTHFRVLKDIRAGDDIVLETPAGQFLYRVRRTRVVDPKNTSALQSTDTPELNLITCYPFYYVGSAPERFVVEARLAGLIHRTS